MATKKSTPAKKTAPAKKTVPTKGAAKKAAPKKAEKAAPKKAAPAKTVAKAAPPKKAVPAKTAKVPVKKAAGSAAIAPVAKNPVKAAPKKPVRASGGSAASKVAVEKTVQPAQKKPVPKPLPKKEPSGKPPVVPKLSTKSAVKYTPDFTKSILDTHKNEKVKSVVRYSDSDLQEFKEIILRKLDAAKKELAYLQGLITRRDEGGDMDEGRYMTMEDGGVSMEREQLSQLASRQITFIDHLEKALMRVENKTYGICRVTGNLIDKARLRAVPHATLSMEAKSMMNK